MKASGKMKPNSKEAKALLYTLETVKVGDKLEFDGFLTGFGTKVQAHCVEVEENRFWQFCLYWNSISIQSVVVERTPDELIVECLGA